MLTRYLLDEGDAGKEKVSPWFAKISRYSLKRIAEHIDSLDSIVEEGIHSLSRVCCVLQIAPISVTPSEKSSS